MQRLTRSILIAILAATLAGGALAPAVTQAAPPAWHPHRPLLQWADSGDVFTVRHGRHHEFTVSARFRTATRINHAVFFISLQGSPYVRPTSISWGTILPSSFWRVLSFTVIVPAATPVGRYAGTVRLATRERPRDFDRFGGPFRFAVRVVPAPPPPPQATITWTPAGLGTITVHRGQTITETASFVSNMNLTNVQVLSALKLTHVQIAIVSPVPASVSAGAPVTVMFTVSADALAGIAIHPTYLYVTGSTGGGPAVVLHRGLHFNVDVDRAPPPPQATITWTPAGLGAVTVRRGETVTATASFVSNMNLTNVQVLSALKLTHVQIAITPAALPSVAANTPVQVTFTVSADALAGVAIHPTYLYVMGSTAGGPVVVLHRGLHFNVDVDAAPTALVTWPSGSPATYPSITISRGGAPASEAESGTFMSNVALSSVTFVSSVSGPSPSALSVTVAPLASPTVAAATPTAVSFTIGVLPTAKAGLYRGVIYVVAMSPGTTAPHALHYGLHFVVAVSVAKS